MPWDDGLLYTNPGANQVLVDTGPRSKGTCRLEVFLWGSNAYEVVLELRNAANDTTLKSQVLGVSLTNLPLVVRMPIPVEDGERIRVKTRAAVTGDVEASLFYE